MIESKIRRVNKLTNHLSIPRSTRYNVFSKCNSIREDLIKENHNIKCSSVSKRKITYPLISDLLEVMIQESIIKYSSIVAFPIIKIPYYFEIV